MNSDTLVVICGYEGDAKRVRNFLPFQEHHECPIVILSPTDSPILKMRNHICRQAGLRAYIGQASLDRQIAYFRLLIESYPFEYYLLNDSDSFIVSAQLPQIWYDNAKNTVWLNRIQDPRTHESPYPKWAFQPPYFMARESMERLIAVADRCPAHPITPYVDHFMVQLTYESGLGHRPFTDGEHAPRTNKSFVSDDPWKILEYRIKYCGTVAMHPIKTSSQATLCARARRFYEVMEKGK